MRTRHTAPMVMAVALVVAACSGTSSDETSSTTAPSVTTTAPPPVIETVWRFQSPLLDENRGYMLDVATRFPPMPDRPGLVAAGFVSRDDGEVPAIWASRDGSTWDPVELAPAEYETTGRIRSIVRIGDGYVAGGSTGGVAAVWRSPDATSWSRVLDEDIATPASDPTIAPLPSEIIDLVAAADGGIVAVGAVGDAPSIWTSADGAEWDRVPPGPVTFAGGAQVMFGVATDGSSLVAVGADGPSGAIWHAVTPDKWTRVPGDDALFGNTVVWDVAVGGPGWVAVGTAPTPEGDILGAAVWVSADGVAWQRVEGQESFEGRRSMLSVTALEGTMYAAGSTFDDRGVASATVWRSTDGLSWELVEAEVFDAEVIPGDIAAIAGFGDGLVAVGRSTAFLGVWHTETIVREAGG